jgi:hypothetical protein
MVGTPLQGHPLLLDMQVSTAPEISGWVDSSCPSWRTWFVRVGGHELSRVAVRSVG